MSCCCGGPILLWEIDNYDPTFAVSLNEVAAVYGALGVTCHRWHNWSGVLDDYGLVIWPIAAQDPIWWPQLTAWAGRLHITAEWYPDYGISIDYINSKIGLHGMMVNNDISTIHGGCFGIAPSMPHPLTNGVPQLHHEVTASLAGGATLFEADFDFPPILRPMMMQKKPGNIDWVIAGDSNHLIDECTGNPGLNQVFLRNLYQVPL